MFLKLPEYVVLAAIMLALSVTVTESLKGPCTIDAATTWVRNGRMYFFKGDGYVIWDDKNDKSSEWRSMVSWPGVPSNLDAATSWGGFNYFFKGCSYYKYDKNNRLVGGPYDIPIGWKAPCNLDAAAVWNGKTYFFKGNSYVGWLGHYNWNGTIGPNWDGMEGNIDAGVKWHKNGKTYFFKGDDYWRFDGVKSVKLKIHERNHWKGLMDNLLKDCPCDCDRCCNEKWKFHGIQYHTTNRTVHKYTPEILGKQIVDNRGSSGSPNIEFQVSKTITETESFSHTAGASVTIGMSFSIGIPIIAEAEGSIEVTASYEHTWGTEKSVSKTRSATYNCPAQPGKKVTCYSKLSMGITEVPYTMTLRHEDKDCTCESQGIFKKVAIANMVLDMEEE